MKLKKTEVLDFLRKEWNGDDCGIQQHPDPEVRIVCNLQKATEELDRGSKYILYMRRMVMTTIDNNNQLSFSVMSITVED